MNFTVCMYYQLFNLWQVLIYAAYYTIHTVPIFSWCHKPKILSWVWSQPHTPELNEISFTFREFSTVLRDIPPTNSISATMRLNTIGNNLDQIDDQPGTGHVNSAFDSTDFEVVNNNVEEEEEELGEDIVSHISPFSRSG